MALKLDIGGTIFKTSRSTLTKYDCMLKRMLESGIPLKTDNSVCVFIDRDPTHFRYILNFMRDGKVELPENQKEIKEILNEAEFYKIKGLIDFSSRLAKNHAELQEILAEATRDVLVLSFPPDFEEFPLNNTIVQNFIQKYKHKVDIVLIEDPESCSYWTCHFHPIDKSKAFDYESWPDTAAGFKQMFKNLDIWLM